MAAVTNDHKISGFKQTKWVLYNPGGQKSKVIWQSCLPSGGSQGELISLFFFFLLLDTPYIPEHMTLGPSDFCLSHHVSCSDSDPPASSEEPVMTRNLGRASHHNILSLITLAKSLCHGRQRSHGIWGLGYGHLCGGRGGIILPTPTSILEKGRQSNFGIVYIFFS